MQKTKSKQAITLSADSMFTSTNTLSCVLAKWLAMRNIYAATQTTPSGWFVSSIAADGEAALSDEVFFATIPC